MKDLFESNQTAPPPSQNNANEHGVGRSTSASKTSAVKGQTCPLGHILIAEDNPINAHVIEVMLKTAGYSTELAGDGAVAVDRTTRALRPDLVLMDIQMPVMDGYAAMQKIRAWESEQRQPHITIVALTANDQDQDRCNCLAAGADDFLTKPIRWTDLSATLEKWLHSKPPSEDSGVTTGKSPSAHPSNPLPGVWGFDVQTALTRVGGDVAQYLRFLEVFQTRAITSMEALRTAMLQQNAPTARAVSHSLKGSAGLLGAESLQRALGELESACRDSRIDHALLTTVESVWADTVGSLQKLLLSSSGINGKAGTVMMEIAGSELSPNDLPAGTHLLIVDDDPLASEMLSMALSKHGFAVQSVTSGSACLAAMDAFVPLVILLDIEMPGMDGYETCQSIRNRYDRSELTIIFLSIHDTLDERLRAYDVGGDDFVTKPFDAEEMQRKIGIAVAARAHRKESLATQQFLEESVHGAMQSFSDAGAALRFARGTLGCHTLNALGNLIIEAMHFTDSLCHVYLSGSAAAGTLMLTPSGPATPLEESVIVSMRSHDRIFQFKSRMIVNYEAVSILIVNVPITDEVLAGRIRDYAAIVAEVAQDAVANISLRADMLRQAEELQQLAQSCSDKTLTVQTIGQAQQMEVRQELAKMTERIEAMYYRLGLSDQQESIISDTVRDAVNEVIGLFSQYGNEFSQELVTIIDRLRKVSETRLDTVKQSNPADELWG